MSDTVKKEYGGYIELETNRGREYHENARALNSACSAFAYLAKAKGIGKVYLPAFLCASVKNTCEKHGIAYEYYGVGTDFRPILPTAAEDDAWIYLVNYYGQITDAEILSYKEKFPRLIVDNAQAFFRMPVAGTDTLYSCRKFFGVPDGAYLYSDCKALSDVKEDTSHDRMGYLLGRFEKTASEFYGDYQQSEEALFQKDVMHMSKLTHNLLRGIDYEAVKKIRSENFEFLHRALGGINRLSLSAAEGAFMYPLYLENGGEIRKKLQAQKIYIPTLWPDVLTLCEKNDPEYQMAQNILPLPLDQRYNKNDMEVIAKAVITQFGEETE